jgi:WD40 repeat protein
VTCVRFRKPVVPTDEEVMATSHLGGSVKVHRRDKTSGKFEVAAEFKDHFFPVNDLDFAEHNPWLASCANDTIVNMFDIEKAKLCRSFLGGHQSFVTKVMFNKQENLLLSTGADNFLYFWDVRQNKVTQKFLAHPEPITGLDISFDSTTVLTSAYDGYVRLWDMYRSSCIKTMVAESGSTSAVSICKLTSNAKYIFIGNMNGALGLYDLDNRLVKAYSGHKNYEYCLDFCIANVDYKGKRNVIMTGGEDGRLVGWDLNSQKVVVNQ